MKKSRKKKIGAARPGQLVRADSEPVRTDGQSDVLIFDPSPSPDAQEDASPSPETHGDASASPDEPQDVSPCSEEPSENSPDSAEKRPPIHHDNPFIPDVTDDLSGLKIRSINLVVIAAAAVLLALFLSSSVLTSTSYQNLQDANNKYIAAELAANQLKHASYYLTTQVRMFAVTQDTKYMDRYFEEALVKRNREQANDTLKTYLPNNYAFIYLDEAYRYSGELMKRECRAMRLVIEACNYLPGGDAASVLNSVELTERELAMSAEEKIQAAMDMTHDAHYQLYTDLIEERVDSCIRCVTEERAKAEEENAYILNEQAFAQRAFAICLMLITVVTIVTVMNLVMWPMNAFVNCIRHYQPLPMIGAYELRYLARAYNIMYNENQKTSAHLRHKAEHDPLTSLYNRGTFDRLREEYANLPIALMLIDVDLFKTINDTHGHETGDDVLKKVARLLDQNFRETDFPCRVGGDEFAVIMTDASSDMKELVREKILRISEALQDTSDGVPSVTLSVGVAFNDRDGGTEDIYKDADRALYVVKTHGRNGVEFYGEHYMKLGCA